MIKAILIDDSTASIEALEHKLKKHCPEIEIVQTCTDPFKAIEAISFYRPDVIFLDVEMPAMNGFALLQQLPVIDFEIIFVTAYNHYAIPAIRVNALDYLEKPVNVPLLKEAAERLHKKIKLQENKPASGEPEIKKLLEAIQHLPQKQAALALPSSGGIEMASLEDIVWLESVNNYTRFHFANGKKILVSKTIGEYEGRLKEFGFIRIHRSHIINLQYLHKYHRDDSNVEMKNGTMLEVAIRKKQELLDKLKTLS